MVPSGTLRSVVKNHYNCIFSDSLWFFFLLNWCRLLNCAFLYVKCFIVFSVYSWQWLRFCEQCTWLLQFRSLFVIIMCHDFCNVSCSKLFNLAQAYPDIILFVCLYCNFVFACITIYCRCVVLRVFSFFQLYYYLFSCCLFFSAFCVSCFIHPWKWHTETYQLVIDNLLLHNQQEYQCPDNISEYYSKQRFMMDSSLYCKLYYLNYQART